MLWLILLITGFAGVIGTGLGGVIGGFFGVSNEKTLGNVLNFAGGIMLAVVCFDLIPEGLVICLDTVKMGVLPSIIIVICGLFAGVIIVMLTNTFVEAAQDKKALVIKSNNSKTEGLFKAGMVVFFAIAIHNLPEGMAIGSGGCIDPNKAYSLALLIALHNIPEGMSISCPLIAGGTSKVKAILLSGLSGASTILGGLIGYLVSGISPIFNAMCVIFAGGAMLYVTFSELIPKSISLSTSKFSTIYVIIGIAIGLSLTYLLKV